MLRAGDFFVGPYPPGSGKKRRFLVVTDEERREATVVWVFTSTTTDDRSVRLPKGCHPEIVQDCWVAYERATIVETRFVRNAVAARALAECEPLSIDILRTVQDGIFGSPDTPEEVLDYCDGRI